MPKRKTRNTRERVVKKVKLDLDELDLKRQYTFDEFKFINDDARNSPIKIDGQLVSHFTFKDGRLIPVLQNPIALEAVIHEISRQLGNWNISPFNNKYGIVTTSRGGFNFYTFGGRQQIIQSPSVAFTPNNIYNSLDEDQLWSFHCESFTPIFVVEVVNIISRSQFDEIDYKFKNVYFTTFTSVKLGWLIDPKNRDIWVYKYNKYNEVYRRKYSSGWVDIDGGDILKGFKLDVSKLNALIPQKQEREEESENDESDESDDEGDPCSYCELRFTEALDLVEHIKKNHMKPKNKKKPHEKSHTEKKHTNISKKETKEKGGK